MSAGKGIARGRFHGIAIWEYPCIPDPGTVGAHAYLQHTIDQPVAAPAHQQIASELFVNSPVDDGHDDQHRVQFAQKRHFQQEIRQESARSVPELL